MTSYFGESFTSSSYFEIVIIITTTIVLLIFGEVSPKAFAFATSRKTAVRVAPIIFFLRTYIFKYFVVMLKKASQKILQFTASKEESQALSVEEYRSYSLTAEWLGAFNEDQIYLFNRVFNLVEKPVKKLMIPRTEIQSIHLADKVDKIEKLVKRKRYLYVPVVEEDLDSPIGMLNVVTFLTASKNERDQWQKTMLETVVYTPENSTLQAALENFFQAKNKVSLVVDEYGGIEGMLTVEDIFEEVLGEMPTEYEPPGKFFMEVKDGLWRISGRYPFEDALREIGANYLPETNAETIGGFVSQELDHIPEVGEKIIIKDFEIEVSLVQNKRILQLKVLRLNEEVDDGNS